MELYKLEFEIPGLPSSGNGKLGDSAQGQWVENKKWHRLVHLAVAQKLPPKPLNRCRLILARHGSLPLDYDNLVISFKSIVDGLVDSGVLADDSFKVTGDWILHQIKTKRKETKVYVSVVELPYSGADVIRRRKKTKSSTAKQRHAFFKRRS